MRNKHKNRRIQKKKHFKKTNPTRRTLLTDNVFRRTVTLRPVQCRIDVDRERDHLPAALRILLGRDHVVQVGETLQVLDVRLLRQLVGRFVRLRAHLETAAALGVQVAQALGALLAAGAALHVALAALRQHALGDDRGAHHLVAARR